MGPLRRPRAARRTPAPPPSAVRAGQRPPRRSPARRSQPGPAGPTPADGRAGGRGGAAPRPGARVPGTESSEESTGLGRPRGAPGVPRPAGKFRFRFEMSPSLGNPKADAARGRRARRSGLRKRGPPVSACGGRRGPGPRLGPAGRWCPTTVPARVVIYQVWEACTAEHQDRASP